MHVMHRSEIALSSGTRLDPPWKAVTLALMIGGHYFHDSGGSVVQLVERTPHLMDRNSVLIYDTAEFMHEVGEPGWYVLGEKRLLRLFQGSEGDPLSVRQVIQASAVESVWFRHLLAHKIVTQTVHRTPVSHIHNGEWRVLLERKEGTNALTAVLKDERSIPSCDIGVVRVA